MIRDIILFIAALYVAVRILQKPVFGLYCSVFLLPFGKLAAFNLPGNGFLFIYFTVILTFISEFIRLLIGGIKLPRLLHDYKYSLVLFFFVYIALSIFLSAMVGTPFYKGEYAYLRSLKQILLFSFAVLFYYQLIYYIKDHAVLKRVLQVFVASFAFVTVLCLLEFLNYFLTDPVTTFLFNFWHNASTGSGIFPLNVPMGLERGNLPRLRGPLSEPSILGMHIVLAFFMLLLIKRRYAELISDRYSYLLPAMLFILVFTFSRSSQVVFLLGLFLLFLLRSANIRVKRIALLVLIVALPLLYKPISRSLNEIGKLSGPDLSKDTRSANIRTGLNIFLHYPILGVGIGNYGFYYRSHIPEETNGFRYTHEINASLNPDHPRWPVSNNFFVRILAELGIAGMSLFLLFQFYILNCIRELSLSVSFRTWGNYYFIVILLLLAFYSTNESFQFFIYWFIPGMIAATHAIMKNEMRGAYT